MISQITQHFSRKKADFFLLPPLFFVLTGRKNLIKIEKTVKKKSLSKQNFFKKENKQQQQQRKKSVTIRQSRMAKQKTKNNTKVFEAKNQKKVSVKEKIVKALTPQSNWENKVKIKIKLKLKCE